MMANLSRKGCVRMKRMFLILLCMLLATPALALGEAEENRMEFAFGLFSVALPQGMSHSPVEADMMFDMTSWVDGLTMPVGVSYAPLDRYESTAAAALDSRVSMLYALSGGGDYTETEVAEETLPGGVKLRWQLMQGSAMHTLWFEAFTENFGYNMTLSGEPTAEADEMLLGVMRSFTADAEQELDILQIRQTALPGGAFISCEHGLQLQLDESWNIVTDPGLLMPETAFILEKEEYRWMIQLIYVTSWPADGAQRLLEAYLDMRGASGLGEPETITLEGLGGVQAVTVTEQSGIYMQHIAFVHEGYGYCGSFMWIVPDEAVARPFMEEAIRTMSVPE